jgi:hypothetical protein
VLTGWPAHAPWQVDFGVVDALLPVIGDRKTKARAGLGRLVALYNRASTLYQIHYRIRCLY